MQSKEPIENFFDKLAEILSLGEDSKNKLEGKIPPNMEVRIKKLIRDMELYCLVGEATLKNLPVSTEKIESALTTIEDLPAKDQQVLQKAQKLKEQLDLLQRDIGIKVTIAKQKEKNFGKEGKESTARQKKFRKMGGKKNWRPL
jgi:hypothetical protein